MAREKIHATASDRVAAYRERNQVVQLCVYLPADLVAQFEEWMRFKNVTKREVIEKLIRSQLLRKR